MPRIPEYSPSVKLTHLGPNLEQDINSYGLEYQINAQERRGEAQQRLKEGQDRRRAGAEVSQQLLEEGKSQAVNYLVAAKNWEGVSKFGDEMSEAGVKLNQAMNHAKQVTALAGMKTDTKLFLYDLQEEVKKDPDPEKWAPAFKEKAEKYFEETAQRSSDAGVQAHYKAAWASTFPVMAHSVKTEAHKQRIANYNGDLETNYGKSVDLYLRAKTDVERAQIQSDVFGMLQGGVSAGLLLPAKAQQLREGFERSVTLSRVNGDISDDPVGTFNRLANPAANYPGLADQDALALRGRAHAEMGRVQGDNALEVQKLYEQKQLTPETLKQMRDGRTISMGTWKFYDAAMQADAAPVKAAKDNDLYVRRWGQALKGKLSEDQVFNDLRSGVITKSDAHYLLNTNSKAAVGETADDMTFTKSPYYKAALWELNHQAKLIDDSMLNMGNKMRPGVKEPTTQAQATVMFLDECRQAQKEGVPPGNWMLESAQKIIKPFQVMGIKGMKPGGAAAPAAGGDDRQRALEILRKRGRLPAQ